MDTTGILIVMAGALAGGFVNGLAGFGTGLVALGFWLHVLPPMIAGPLAVVCSVASQVQTLPAIWRAIEPRRVLPFILPGLLGVPVGMALLDRLDPGAFRIGMGLFLLAFSLFSLLSGKGMAIAWGGRIADGVVGLMGGVLGGLCGLSGPLPTVWATLRGWGKKERRSLFQSYNLSVLCFALAGLALSGHLTRELGLATLAALPGTLTGALLGARAYRRLSDFHFNKVILCLLALSGVTLLWPGG